jgi:hypothetical protein
MCSAGVHPQLLPTTRIGATFMLSLPVSMLFFGNSSTHRTRRKGSKEKTLNKGKDFTEGLSSITKSQSLQKFSAFAFLKILPLRSLRLVNYYREL